MVYGDEFESDGTLFLAANVTIYRPKAETHSLQCYRYAQCSCIARHIASQRRVHESARKDPNYIGSN